jgi:deoxyadenosine/deoxycytidine kinase
MNYAKHQKRYVIVEGNIGAGKSTFLRIIKDRLSLPIIFEPVDKWQVVADGQNLLEKFYSDTNRWAYTFQSYAFITRIFALEQALKKDYDTCHVLERSIYSDRYCFAKNCYEQGIMSRLEWQLYQEWFAWLTDHRMSLPIGFIYLRATPDICYQRLIKRGRLEESPVSVDYLEQLHEKHDAWLLKKKEIASNIAQLPVLVLDCNKEFENDELQQEAFIKQVKVFIV